MATQFARQPGGILNGFQLPNGDQDEHFWMRFKTIRSLKQLGSGTLDCLLVPLGLLIGEVFEAYLSLEQCHCHFTKCLVPKNWCQMNDMDLIFQMIPHSSL